MNEVEHGAAQWPARRSSGFLFPPVTWCGEEMLWERKLFLWSAFGPYMGWLFTCPCLPRRSHTVLFQLAEGFLKVLEDGDASAC